jgi:hypothetical protein
MDAFRHVSGPIAGSGVAPHYHRWYAAASAEREALVHHHQW